MAITRVRELEEELSEKIVRPRTQIILRRKCVSTICTKSQFGIVCRRIQNRLRSSRKKWAEKWCFYSERNRSTNATMVQMNSRSFFQVLGTKNATWRQLPWNWRTILPPNEKTRWSNDVALLWHEFGRRVKEATDGRRWNINRGKSNYENHSFQSMSMRGQNFDKKRRVVGDE